MFFSILKCQLKAFADDHQLYTSGTNKQVQAYLNEAANKTDKWYEQNLLLANKSKYQSATIKGTLRDTPNIKVKVKGTQFEQTSVLKLLGVHIDDKLNLGEQAKTMCIKMSGQVGVLHYSGES